MSITTEQRDRVAKGQGFIAALDQSGGSTPKALKLYGVDESEYSNDKEMFELVHKMRERIVSSPAFPSISSPSGGRTRRNPCRRRSR